MREISTDWMMTPRAGVKGITVRLCVLLVVLQAIFLGLLVLAQAVPDEPIVAHLLEAVEEGTYASNLEPDNMGGTSSSFTECILVGTGLGRPELGPWERALRMPRIGNCARARGPAPAGGWRTGRRRRGVFSLLGGLDSDIEAGARAVGARGTSPDLGGDAGALRRCSGRAGG